MPQISFKEKVFRNVEACRHIWQTWKEQQIKIVFTNGCFDLLHIGHVSYLEEAKNLGDKLIVGVNSDASVRRLKGPNRPIKDEYNRMNILAALQSVDLVILFDDDDPFELIDTLQPDILVKGGDWKTSEIIGSNIVLNNGGIVRTLKFVEGYSTTAIEQKIKNTI